MAVSRKKAPSGQRPRTNRAIAIENVVGQFIGCRVAFTWFGSKKGLTDEQKQMAADPFDADGGFLAARKKILDTGSEAFRAVTNVRTRVNKYWAALTIPYIEPGVRLIKLEHVGAFRDQMAEFQEELRQAVLALDLVYAGLRAEACASLGSLYDDADYPESLVGQFEVGYDFPSIHPPEELKYLDEAAFNDEVDKFRAKLDETVKLTEAAFVDEFTKMVSHMRETLAGMNSEDGKKRIFKDAQINNLRTFFDRFEVLNLGSNPKFSEIVKAAKDIVGGASPDDLRGVADVRAAVVDGFAGIEEELKAMTVERPKRKIIRTRDAEPGAEGQETTPDKED